MRITYREALETDIESITQIYNDSIKIFPPSIRKDSEMELFVDFFNNNSVIIAENIEKSETIGWIAYNIKKDYTFIAGLYVKFSEQKKGTGTKLLDYCIKTLNKNNCKLVILHALKIAPWSIGFYGKNNFLIYEIDNNYEEDLNCIKSRKINNWEKLMYRKI